MLMNRRKFIKKIGIALSSSVILAGFSNCSLKKRNPNIILIISDDAGYSDFGFTGGKQISTPNLDKLANEGITCTQGYVTAAVCCPSRMGLMTGRYQQRFGAECNCPVIPTPGFNKEDLGLDLTETTIAQELQNSGYNTMMIGKWHLGELPQYHPLKRGFDECYGFLGGGRSYWPIEKPGHGAAIYKNENIIDETNEIKYTTDDFTDSAIDFIKGNKDNPFFIYLSYNAVHTPMHAKIEDIEQQVDITPEKRKIYAAMTKSLDENVGRVLKYLKKSKIDDDTIVIFINDNGGATNNASVNKPLRGHKGTYFEGGIRVPYIIKWQGNLNAGEEYNEPVSTFDILPTLEAITGTKHTGKSLDGVNILPYLQGVKTGSPHEYLFWRLWRSAAVRKGNYKLLKIADNPLMDDRKLLLPLMLFDLQNDPGETRNIASQEPQITLELLAALENWEKEMEKPRWYDGASWQYWENEHVKNHRIN